MIMPSSCPWADRRVGSRDDAWAEAGSNSSHRKLLFSFQIMQIIWYCLFSVYGNAEHDSENYNGANLSPGTSFKKYLKRKSLYMISEFVPAKKLFRMIRKS